MRADPEPRDRVAIADSECAIAQADARRVDRLADVHGFEPKTRVCRVGREQAICSTSLPSHVLGQARECLSKPLRGD